MPRRLAVGSACSTADSTAVRRSSGRRSSRTRPESSFDSSSRFWASQSSRSSCWRLDSRNSARVAGSSSGALAQQLVEHAHGGDRRSQLVRHVGQEVPAAIAIAADDRDALVEPAGHLVELARQLDDLGAAGIARIDRDPALEVALGQVAGRLGQAAERDGEAPGKERRDHDGQDQAGDRDDDQERHDRLRGCSPGTCTGSRAGPRCRTRTGCSAGLGSAPDRCTGCRRGPGQAGAWPRAQR